MLNIKSLWAHTRLDSSDSRTEEKKRAPPTEIQPASTENLKEADVTDTHTVTDSWSLGSVVQRLWLQLIHTDWTGSACRDVNSCKKKTNIPAARALKPHCWSAKSTILQPPTVRTVRSMTPDECLSSRSKTFSSSHYFSLSFSSKRRFISSFSWFPRRKEGGEKQRDTRRQKHIRNLWDNRKKRRRCRRISDGGEEDLIYSRGRTL